MVAKSETYDMVEKRLVSEMFVIYEKNAGYRTSRMEDGVIVRNVTNELSLADMFKSADSALDHAVFTLNDQRLSPENPLEVRGVRVEQRVITHFFVHEGEPSHIVND